MLGDSIAPEGYLVASAMWPSASLLTAEKAGCPPLRELEGIQHSFGRCELLNERRLGDIAESANRIDTVVLAMRLDEERLSPVVDIIEWLEGLGIDVEVYGLGAHYDQSAWQTIAGHGEVEGIGEALHARLDVTAELNREYVGGATDAGGSYIDRWDWMCDDASRRAFVGEDVTDLVMIDAAHMTRTGALAFADARDLPHVDYAVLWRSRAGIAPTVKGLTVE